MYLISVIFLSPMDTQVSVVTKSAFFPASMGSENISLTQNLMP